ncbi:DUF3298 and DUF4163 domain-containing protein [Clostridium thermarum]|uniref:DUF3298 and DUF4163 domain-containing protein n=1 Tax=Clostridium thermarum TaxID=1716543 RepID=UPI0013D1907B|nr:DUF3298 and DUF4163 domain-containing protein [Clostridium thermarum]
MKRSIRLIIDSALIISMVISSLGCTKKSETVNSNNADSKRSIQKTPASININNIEKTEEVKVLVTEKAIKEDTEALLVDIKLPVLSGLANKDIEKNLNSKFETEAMRLKASLEEEAKGALQDSKDNNLEYHKYEVNTSYKVNYNRNGFLSITVVYYRYTGGAHGLSYMKGYNIDLKTGGIYSLSQLFDKDFNYKEIIDEVVLNEMKANRELYFEDAITDFKGIKKDHPFYIEEGNLVVYFAEYEIAPYAHGMPEFRVPLSKLTFAEGIKLAISND